VLEDAALLVNPETFLKCPGMKTLLLDDALRARPIQKGRNRLRNSRGSWRQIGWLRCIRRQKQQIEN
jgi:hypothetical protein